MPRIVVAGGVNCDEIVRLAAPLVPGGAGRGTSGGIRLGGGGPNAAVALTLAGHSVALSGVVGRDSAGTSLIEAVGARGVDARWVRRSDGPTTRMLILIDPQGERTVVRVGPHRAAELTEEDIPAAIDGAPVEGMFVKAFSPGLATAMARVANRAADRTVIVAEFPPPDFANAWPAHILIGSRTALPAEALADPFGWGRACAGASLRLAVVTNGAAGAIAHDGRRTIAVPPVPVRQVDATGAGDAFAAGLLHGLVQGRSLEDALASAAAWGALAAASDGSVLPESAAADLRRV